MATITEAPRSAAGSGSPVPAGQFSQIVQDELQKTPIIDMHTHLFMPSLGRLGLWGIDELLTYHYLEAELFRFSSMKPANYWSLTKKEQADLIWRTLFIENTPASESCRGVIAVLSALGLNTAKPDLTEAREYFEAQKLESHIRHVFERRWDQ